MIRLNITNELLKNGNISIFFYIALKSTLVEYLVTIIPNNKPKSDILMKNI